jgi:hypothetical protein
MPRITRNQGEAMAENTPKTPGTFDPEALLAIQRRNVEAFTSAGKIVAEGMRTYAERQAGMMQEAMHNLWGELQTGSHAPRTGDPADQHARLRAAFDKVLSQVQELSQSLLKAQSEAMAVLNDCAAANMKAFGGMAPDFAAMQKAATEAMQTASRQATAAIEEMRKRMIALQEETRQAMGTAKESSAESATAAPEGKRKGGTKS